MNSSIAAAAAGSLYLSSPITSGCDSPFAVSSASIERRSRSSSAGSQRGWTSNQRGIGFPLARSACTWPDIPGQKPSGGALATFIGDRWSDKIKKVFDVGNDADASRHYNRLHSIAETYAHGGFGKEGGAAVWVHLLGLGAVPARLSDIRDAPHFELFPVDEKDLGEITNAYAEVDEWLRTTKTKYGIRFAEAGLDVAYDEESRRQYAEAMADDDAFERFIEATSRVQDDLANFDF